ncbi:hypothetical protein [Roseibium sp.]|uniref:hypothetical protein n=1 Tax=Roseibium sp. TaxID=1936156 RepID=UPI003BAE4FBD
MQFIIFLATFCLLFCTQALATGDFVICFDPAQNACSPPIGAGYRHENRDEMRFWGKRTCQIKYPSHTKSGAAWRVITGSEFQIQSFRQKNCRTIWPYEGIALGKPFRNYDISGVWQTDNSGVSELRCFHELHLEDNNSGGFKGTDTWNCRIYMYGSGTYEPGGRCHAVSIQFPVTVNGKGPKYQFTKSGGLPGVSCLLGDMWPDVSKTIAGTLELKNGKLHFGDQIYHKSPK